MSKNKEPHRHLKSSVARLMAVQARYGLAHNPEPLKIVLNDYLSRYSRMEVDGDTLPEPDKALLSGVLQGVEERQAELQEMIDGVLNKDREGGAGRSPEPLLNAILLCGAYELLANHDIDAPVIINDYLDITHSFYSQNEVALVNGVLDGLHRALRG